MVNIRVDPLKGKMAVWTHWLQLSPRSAMEGGNGAAREPLVYYIPMFNTNFLPISTLLVGLLAIP